VTPADLHAVAARRPRRLRQVEYL